MPQTFHHRCRVEWHDTDAAGIAHFTAFFRFMEETEHAFLRSLGYSVLEQVDGRRFSWPRVSVGCEFSGAVKFDDLLDIELSVERLGEKSVSYRFQMAHAGRPVAEGRSTAVYCQLHDDGPPRSAAIPPALAERLSTYTAGP